MKVPYYDSFFELIHPFYFRILVVAWCPPRILAKDPHSPTLWGGPCRPLCQTNHLRNLCINILQLSYIALLFFSFTSCSICNHIYKLWNVKCDMSESCLNIHTSLGRGAFIINNIGHNIVLVIYHLYILYIHRTTGFRLYYIFRGWFTMKK